MTDPTLSQFKLLCFDVYGTLMDWETGVYERLSPILARTHKHWARKDALQAFQSVELDLMAQNPSALYSQILSDTYYALAKRLEVPESDELKKESETFGKSIADWPVFIDTIPALVRLSKHFRLVVLSNVDKQSFSYTKAVLEHGFKFDMIITAEDVGHYKPDPTNFEYMLKHVQKEFGIEKHEVLVTAQSLSHDHKPANGLGIASSWIARQGAHMGMVSNASYNFKFNTLGDMAASLENELQESR